ncbi:Pro-resilin [Blattella germanica]|nr:Pro-resilin [Blattella germanica]
MLSRLDESILYVKEYWVSLRQYAAKYQFGYQVRDPKHGTYFGHSESRDGHHTKGNYHVLLPDGRLQNVQYWADLSGYHAQVSYNAAAKHPVGKYH